MELPVLIESLPGGVRYRARMGDPINLSAEAATPEEALQLVQTEFQRLLGEGARIAAISFPPSSPIPAPGWLPEDELTREWLDAVEVYRKECDSADRRRILGEDPADKVAS